MLDHYSRTATRGAPARGGRPAPRGGPERAGDRGVLRQPRGVRRGLDAGAAGGVPRAAAATTSCPSCRCCTPAARDPSGSAPTVARRSASSTRRTSSPSCASGRSGTASCSASRATAQPPGDAERYRHADLPEGEGWGWRSVTQTKWATSAAHLYQRPGRVVGDLDLGALAVARRRRRSTWSARRTSTCSCGVNQLIGHGWPYSPPGAQAPGWIFYAAGALNDRNPWWPAMPRAGAVPAAAVLAAPAGHPSSTSRSTRRAATRRGASRPAPRGYLDLWRATREHIGDALPAALREAGYDYDLVDDTALREADWSRYRVVVLPFVRDLPVETARLLEKHAAAAVSSSPWAAPSSGTAGSPSTTSTRCCLRSPPSCRRTPRRAPRRRTSASCTAAPATSTSTSW